MATSRHTAILTVVAPRFFSNDAFFRKFKLLVFNFESPALVETCPFAFISAPALDHAQSQFDLTVSCDRTFYPAFPFPL